MKNITIGVSTWNRSASYGRIAVETKDYLEKKGYWVNTVGRDAPNQTFKPGLLNFLIGYPTNYASFGLIAQYGRRVAFSTFESSIIPEEWVEILNKCDSVIVPCQWNAETYAAGGVNIPIHVVPHGISEGFHYVERPKREKFRFLTIGDQGHRKGFIDAISAFVKAFGDKEDVELIIKARTLSARSNLINLTNKNIRVIDEDYTDQEMCELYGSCECMVFPAHGEGFGWPPREFAATGGISLATNYGGLADELEHWGIGLQYHLVPAWPFPPSNAKHFFHQGEWADVDVDYLSERMLEIYNMDYNERIALGKQFSDFTLGFYTWNKHCEKVMELLGLNHADK